MDRIASSRVVDPHHDQPPPSLGPAEDRMVVAERVVAFIACCVCRDRDEKGGGRRCGRALTTLAKDTLSGPEWDRDQGIRLRLRHRRGAQPSGGGEMSVAH